MNKIRRRLAAGAMAWMLLWCGNPVLPVRAGERAPEIRCDVALIDNHSASFDIGQAHSWYLRCRIPSDIAGAEKYEITDVLDYRLRYQPGTAAVQVVDPAGLLGKLKQGEHYRLTEGTASRGRYIVDKLTVSLTSEGMALLGAYADREGAELRIRFQAVIAENTSLGSAIPNDAHLEYIGGDGQSLRSDSNIPEVHTGGLVIQKTDEAGNPLPGAVFMIAREATPAELKKGGRAVEVLSVDNRELAVVFPEFYTDLQGQPACQGTTDGEGRVRLLGLAYGTYYLVESQAPAGYDPLGQPLKVQIDETSHLTAEDGWLTREGEVLDRTVTIVNARFRLPDTGERGDLPFWAIGTLFFLGGMVLLTDRRKRI